MTLSFPEWDSNPETFGTGVFYEFTDAAIDLTGGMGRPRRADEPKTPEEPPRAN